MELFLIVGKAPIAGFAKTRLAREIGNEPTIEIYEAMLHDFFRRLSKEGKDLPIFLYITPWTSDSIEYFSKLLTGVELKNFVLRPQPERNGLFQRLQEIFSLLKVEMNDTFFTHLTGTDIPHFPFNEISEVKLENKVIVGPDIDGGFYYLGCWDKNLDLLNPQGLIESNINVLNTIYKRIDEKGLSKIVLNKLNDIDDLNDLQNFCQTVQGNYRTKEVAQKCLRQKIPMKTN